MKIKITAFKSDRIMDNFSSKFSLMLYCFCNTNTMHMKRITMNKTIRDCLKEKQNIKSRQPR